MGKSTIDTNTYGKSTGNSGNYSTNFQQTGRELLTADEVRMLDNEKAILLIRGEKPVIDLKYDIMKHPNIKFTTDGEGEIYNHGTVDKSMGTISLLKLDELEKIKNTIDVKNIDDMEEIKDITYELLTEEDIENYFLMEEYENEKGNEKK